MSNSDDKLLQDYLEGKSKITDQYQKEATGEVPPIIDETILSTARFSVRANKKDSKIKTIIDKWQVPLSIAAVMVISVSLVITLYDEYGQGYIDTPSEQPIPQVIQDADDFSPAPEPTSASPAAGAEPVAPMAETIVIDTEPMEERDIPARAKAITNEASKQEQVEQLQQDIEQLKRTQSTLLKERQVLEQELDANEIKKDKIQNTLGSSPVEMTDENPDIQITLSQINELWQQGQHEKARQLLQVLLEQNPDLHLQSLEPRLPEALTAPVR